MKRIPLSTKLSVGYIAVILVTALIVGTISSRFIREGALERLEQNLDEVTKVIAAFHASNPSLLWSENLGRQVKEIAGETGLSLSIALANGRWLASSEPDLDLATNILDRIEVQQARQTGRGIHLTAPIGREDSRLIVTRPILIDWEFVGFVTMGAPTMELAIRERALRNWIAGISALIAILVALASYFINRHILRPLYFITETCQKISLGAVETRIPVRRNDELGIVAETVNQMADALSKKIRGEKERRNHLEAILGLMNDAILVVDKHGSVLFCNKRALRFFSSCQAAKEQQHYSKSLKCPELVELLDGHFKHPQWTTRPLSIEQDKNIVAHWEATFVDFGAAHPLFQGTLVVLHDVTELRSFESLRREFASNVSHELKTPIAAIGALIDAVNDPDMTTEQRQRFLQRIEHQNQRLLRLVNELLTLTKLESGSNILEYKTLEIRELEKSLIDTFEPVAANRSIHLSVRLGEGTSPLVADERAVEVILNSLIDNALQHTPQGGTVSVTAVSARKTITFSVVDTGSGIALGHQDRIFERFYRIEKARSRGRGGSGMGLAIVKHLTTSHGGTVSLSSSLGHGSCFSVTLPLEPSDQDASPGSAPLPQGLLGINN